MFFSGTVLVSSKVILVKTASKATEVDVVAQP